MGSQPALQKRRFSPRVTLAVIGLSITSLKLLEPVKKKVVILQKSIHHTPAQKLTDDFVAILAGARGLNEINTGSAVTKRCSVPSGGSRVPSSRSCRKPSTPVQS